MSTFRTPFEDTVTKAVAKVSNSVLNISTIKLVRDQLFHVHPIGGIGSGVAVNEKGYIITNHHVIANSEQVDVTTVDGSKHQGVVVGSDPSTDIAVVKVDANNIPLAETGDSDKLEVGQFAIAIGNPFGFLLGGGPTVTIGVVSALNRHIKLEDKVYESLIQTDAAINPGNSGGPLLDSNGKVIGINTAVISQAHGIGFAIPINTVKSIISDLINYGHIMKPWLGIIAMDITDNISQYYNLPVKSGVLIVKVVQGGPAQASDLSEGDIILTMDQQKITNLRDLQKIVKSKKIGSNIEILIRRGDFEGVSRVTIAENPQ